jgi:thiol-disulfide isomerase/thioredoxin
MKFKLFFLLLLFNFSVSYSQNFPVYTFNEFEPLLNQQNDTVYVVNFWATWCRPCVKEMPAFNQLFEEYKSQKVKILLVSLDFGDNVNKRISSFKHNHNLKPDIIILDDPDSNSWINKVNNNWSGAIPATLIFNKNKRNFYEQSFHFEDLEKELKKFL